MNEKCWVILLWQLASNGRAPSLVRREEWGKDVLSSRSPEPEVPKTGKCLEGTWRFTSEGQGRDPVDYGDLETFNRKMKMNCNQDCKETRKITYTRANKNV